MRYLRQKNLIGDKIHNQTVGVVGAGGLGSFCIRELVALGVKEIKIVEYDNVEESNLNRQILYEDEDVGKNKIDVLKKILPKLNSKILYKFYKTKITKENIKNILKDCDFVFDCVDNIETRKIVNEFCINRGIKLIEGGVEKNYGFAVAQDKNHSCLNCVGYFNKNISSSKDILVTTAAVTASLQVEIFLKILGGKDIFGILYQADMNDFEIEKINLNTQKKCIWHGGDGEKEV